jgi:hypothetical protein
MVLVLLDGHSALYASFAVGVESVALLNPLDHGVPRFAGGAAWIRRSICEPHSYVAAPLMQVKAPGGNIGH